LRKRTTDFLATLALLPACGHQEDAADAASESAQLQEFQRLSAQEIVGAVSIEDATEWIFRGAATGTQLFHGGQVQLFNNYHGKYVKYDDRVGVNLNWTGSLPNNNITLLRQAGAGTLRYGDVIAVGVKDGSNWEYLVYASQDFGINITSRKNNPQYNWSLEGGAAGTPVRAGDKVRLHNKTNSHFVVYCTRPVGINLAWRNNCKKTPAGRVYIP
jgi:hypothetical protein